MAKKELKVKKRKYTRRRKYRKHKTVLVSGIAQRLTNVVDRIEADLNRLERL